MVSRGECGPTPGVALGGFFFELDGDGSVRGDPFEEFALDVEFSLSLGPSGFVEADDDFSACRGDEGWGYSVEGLMGAPEGEAELASFACDDADDAVAFFVVGGGVGA